MATINGTDGNDELTGNSGDTVNGGAGTDTLIVNWKNKSNRDSVSSRGPDANGGYQGSFSNGYGESVNYTSIERFIIDGFDSASNSDSYGLGVGDDIVRLWAGNDFVNVQTGNDWADGGEGEDGISANLQAATGAIFWNLASNSYSGPIGSFTNFEYFGSISLGSGDYGDIVVTTASQRSEIINAGGGDDAITVLNGNDQVTGGTGADTLTIDYSAYSDRNLLTGSAAGFDGHFYVQDRNASVSHRGIENFVITGTNNTNGGDSITTGAGTDEIYGGAGSDTLNGGEGADVLDGGADNDSLIGGGGSDVLYGGAGTDVLAGGAGDDIYVIEDAFETVTEIAGEGFDRVITSLTTYVLQANVDQLSPIPAIIPIASLDLDFRGNSGNNVIEGYMGNDLLRLQDGGSDLAYGFSGNDAYYFGAALSADDYALDSEGAQDQVGLQGNYSGALLQGSHFVGVETFALLGGDDARFGDSASNFYDYDLSLAGAWGAATVFNGNGLRVGEDMTINAAAITSGSIVTFAGFGQATLTGGGQSDGFFFGDGRFNAGDIVNGGSGTDDQIGLRGDYAIDFGAAGYAGAVTGIETIALISASDPRYAPAAGQDFDYNLILGDGLVSGGDMLTIYGVGLRADESMVVNGLGESTGRLRMMGGAGDDTLRGGGGDDILFGGLGRDSLQGRDGADRFVYTEPAQSTESAMDVIFEFQHLVDKIDLSGIDANPSADGNQAFVFIGENAFSGASGEVRAYIVDGYWLVEAELDGVEGADLVIEVGMGSQPLTADDFFL